MKQMLDNAGFDLQSQCKAVLIEEWSGDPKPMPGRHPGLAWSSGVQETLGLSPWPLPPLGAQGYSVVSRQAAEWGDSAPYLPVPEL